MHIIRNIVIALALTGLLGGCNSFGKDYEAAVAQQSTYTDVTGPWVGQWNSESGDGHSGPMRAIITKTADGIYLARYEAQWGKMMTFHNDVELREVEGSGADGMQRFVGSEDLGMMWGVYHYKAKATPVQFNSTYRSEKDHGSYKLVRP